MSLPDLADLPASGPFAPTWRIIPSRFPPIQAFESVAAADDLDAIMALEGWTSDRLVRHRLRRLPRAAWVFGRANASVIMAAFLHPAPGGARFSDAILGAWYAGLAEVTALKEAIHHLRRESVRAGLAEIVSQYRIYRARLAGEDYADIRGLVATAGELYRADDYTAGQAFGARVRAAKRSGIVYASVRDPGGENVVCFHPPAVSAVVQGGHVELTVRPTGKTIVRRL